MRIERRIILLGNLHFKLIGMPPNDKGNYTIPAIEISPSNDAKDGDKSQTTTPLMMSESFRIVQWLDTMYPHPPL
jgi:hypothetical protein